MNCGEFKNVAENLDLDQAVPEISQHLSRCPSCFNWLDEQRALASCLQMLNQEAAAIGPSERVEADLVEAFRARQRHRHRRELRVWAPAAAALFFCMILGGWAVHRLRRQPPAQKLAAAVPVPLAELRPSPDPAPATAIPPAPIHPSPAHARKRRVQEAVRRSAEAGENSASQFFPLPYADSLSPLTGGQIIRIRVPRSALMTVGLPVTPDSMAGYVDAEVVLNDEMVPRAIRFVH